MKISSRAAYATLPLLAAFVLAGCDAGKPGGIPPQGPAEVGVFTLQPSDVTLSSELPGRTTAFLIAEVRPQVGGILLKRQFEEGSEVKAGQILYQIDPAPYRSTLAHAEATLESARLLFERYDRLIEKRAISQQDRDDARAQYLQAKADVETARIDLGYTRITAPISGRIGRSSVTQGALVTANQTEALATVRQLDPIYVDIVQPSTAILRLKEDMASGRLKTASEDQVPVSLTLENGKAYPHMGKLQFAEVSVDQGTGAVTLRAVFPNPDGTLLPGMFVRTQLQQGVRERALLVPQRGITRDSRGTATAFVIDDDNKVQLREVTIDRSIGGDWLINDGLEPGDQVILDGVQNAKPGAVVKPKPIPNGSSSPAEGEEPLSRSSAASSL